VTLWVGLGWAATAGSLATVAGLVIWLRLRGRRANAADAADGSWEFSLENYGSMGRLLAEEDLVFLRSQPGYRPEMGARWKRERHRLFRLYLTELKHDFPRLHAQARTLVAHSDADSADLVGVLMRQELTFMRALAGLELRLLLQRAGVGKVDVAPLIELLEAMRLDLAYRTAPHAG
jgi:hypothetical protein